MEGTNEDVRDTLKQGVISFSQVIEPDKSEKKSEEAVPSCGNENSALCSVEGTSQIILPSKELKSNCYVTSTPKKEVHFLDDPELSSIDGDNMSEQDESLDNTTTIKLQVCESDLTVIPSGGGICNPTTQIMNENSTKLNKRDVESDSEVANNSHLDVSAVKRNLFDIPVSPRLKSRVRQRLYTLVNSIDGHEMRKDMSNNQKLSSIHKTSASLPDFGNTATSIRPFLGINRFIKTPQNLCDIVSDMDKNYFCESANEEANRVANVSYTSAMSNSEDHLYASAVSSVLEARIQNLLIHQEQLCKDQLNFKLQRKELDAQVLAYKDKYLQMVQIAEEMERKLESTEKERVQQMKYFANEIAKQSEIHKETLSLLRLEYEKKCQLVEAAVASARLDITKACDEKIQDIVRSSRERATTLENMYKDQISHLNNVISKLQAEKRLQSLRNSVEVSSDEDRLRMELVQVTKEKDEIKSEIDALKERLATSCNLDQKSLDQKKIIKELEAKQRSLVEEVNVWSEEAKRQLQRSSELENQFQKMTQEFLEESRKLEQRKLDDMKSRFSQEHNFYKSTIDSLKEKLAKMSSENEKLRRQISKMEDDFQARDVNKDVYKSLEQEVTTLRVQLREMTSTLTQEKEDHRLLQNRLHKELSELQNQHKQEMTNYRCVMEREKSVAVSQLVMIHEKETMTRLGDVENSYQEIIKNLQSHFKDQIDEYKKAVKILKLRVKTLEKENPAQLCYLQNVVTS